MKRLLVTSIVAALVLASGVALAQPAAAPAQPPAWGPEMMGPGGPMMGGYGPGMGFGGMMGGGMMGAAGPALAALGLDAAQRIEVVKVGDELRKKRWAVAGQMQDEMARIRDAAWSGKRDHAAILAARKRMSELGQQQLESSLDAADRIDQGPDARAAAAAWAHRPVVDDGRSAVAGVGITDARRMRARWGRVAPA